MRLIGSSPAGIAPVYDLTVEGAGEFFANGLLVHNCADAMRYFLMTQAGMTRGEGLHRTGGYAMHSSAARPPAGVSNAGNQRMFDKALDSAAGKQQEGAGDNTGRLTGRTKPPAPPPALTRGRH